ncbi:hypothetical protein PO124_00885 [Bacillus licheniformis]|nr:hypothetical protein [Bacillus licheniformis]
MHAERLIQSLRNTSDRWKRRTAGRSAIKAAGSVRRRKPPQKQTLAAHTDRKQSSPAQSANRSS